MPQYTFDMNGAIKAGYTRDQIQAFLDQQKESGNDYQLTPTPQATPQQSQQPVQPKSNFLADMLPTAGAVVGGIAGAAVPFLGETGMGEIGGSAVGSGLGEAAKELIEGKPLSGRDIATQGIVGGAGGAVGKGIGAVASKLLPNISKAAPVLENVATDLKQGTRQIRVKPSVRGAGQEQAINATLDKYGIQGTAQQQYSQLQPTLQKIEGNINQVIQDNPDIGASKQDIQDAFMKNLDSSLRSKDLTAPQAKDEINGYLSDLLKANNANKPVITPEMQNVIDQTRSLKSQIQNYENQINHIQEHGTSPNGRMYERDIPALQGLADNLNEKLNNLPEVPNINTNTDNITLAQLRDMKKLVNEDYGPVYAKSQAGQALTPRQKVIMAAWDSLDSAVKNASPEVKGLLTDESNIYKSARSLSSARSNPPTLRLMGTSVPATVTQTGRDIGAGAASLAGKGLASTPGGLSPIISQGVGQVVARSLLPATPEQANQNTQNGQNYPQNNTQSNGSQNNTSGNFNQNTLPPSPIQSNSTIQSDGSQAFPASPQQAFGGMGTGTDTTNPLQGYTINGQPIDPATANLVYKIANYQLDPTKMTSLKNNERQQIINLVSQYDPTYDSSQFPVKQKLRDDYTSGTTGKSIQAFNTAIQHLSLLNQVSQGLGNTNYPLINSVKNNLGYATGNTGMTNFNQVANAVSGEIAKIFKSSGATDSEISNIQKGLSSDMSPAQLQGNITYLIQLMGGKLDALNSQYTQAMGKPADFQIVDPKSQAILQTLQGNANQLPATPPQAFAQ